MFPFMNWGWNSGYQGGYGGSGGGYSGGPGFPMNMFPQQQQRQQPQQPRPPQAQQQRVPVMNRPQPARVGAPQQVATNQNPNPVTSPPQITQSVDPFTGLIWGSNARVMGETRPQWNSGNSGAGYDQAAAEAAAFMSGDVEFARREREQQARMDAAARQGGWAGSPFANVLGGGNRMADEERPEFKANMNWLWYPSALNSLGTTVDRGTERVY